MNKKILIIDTFAIIFRAFYAFIKNPLRTSKGIPTSAIFGFLRMIIKILKTYNPEYLVFALDSPDKTFRHKIYTEYKANRVTPPDDLKVQIPLILELITKMQFHSIQYNGYEADDVIGTLCTRLKNEKDMDVWVVTGDKDILQLVEGNIKVITTSKGITETVIYDSEKVKERWGVYPDKIIDLFALMGDSSDNIPGVKGIGPKTAQELIENYNSLEGIYQNIDGISKKKIKENLIQYEADALLSRELVTIKTDLDFPLNLTDFEWNHLSYENIIPFFEEYELHSILKDEFFSNTKQDLNQVPDKKLDIAKSQMNMNNRGTYHLISKKSLFDQLINDINKSKYLSIDLETTSEDPMKARIIGISFCIESGIAYFVPVYPDGDSDLFDTHAWKDYLKDYDIDLRYLKSQLKMICEDKTIQKIGQNIKYDYMVFKRDWDITIHPIYFDTMIASYVLDTGRSSHGMDYLAESLLNYKTVKYKDIVDKGKTLLDVDLPVVSHYAGEDADITYRLYKLFKPQIDNSVMKDLYYSIELPLIEVLAHMEIAGVSIDQTHFKSMSKDIKQRLDSLQKEIWELSGREFNINSTQQLSEILFTKLGLKHGKKTKTGYSTDVDVLEELANEHQVPMHLLEYRKLAKLKSAYLDSIPKMIDENTHRIHTSFNQTIAQTGRLSSIKPNLQNIPIKEEIGRNIRKGFLAHKGFYIISADYSQIELRILAHMSQDEMLLKAYCEDRDLHTQTASLIYEKVEADISSDERRIAKTINFSVIYGIGARALAKDLKIPNSDAKKFIDQFFKAYSGVTHYIDQQKKLAYEQGYVETLFHRIRYIPEIRSSNNRNRSYGERLAVNTPIQGSSADIIKIAMINIHKDIQQKNLQTMMTIQVHDELVFEVPERELDIMKSIIVDRMQNAVKLSVPLKVSISNGRNWDEAH